MPQKIHVAAPKRRDLQLPQLLGALRPVDGDRSCVRESCTTFQRTRQGSHRKRV